MNRFHSRRRIGVGLYNLAEVPNHIAEEERGLNATGATRSTDGSRRNFMRVRS